MKELLFVSQRKRHPETERPKGRHGEPLRAKETKRVCVHTQGVARELADRQKRLFGSVLIRN